MNRLCQFRGAVLVFGKAISLMWKTSRSSMILLLVINIFLGIIQPINMIISKWFLDALGISLSTGQLLADIVLSIISLFLLSQVSMITSNINSFTKENFSDKMALTINAKILEKSVTLSMRDYDDKETYNTIKMATEQTPMRCVSLVDVITSLSQRIVQLIGVIGIVVTFNWVVVLVSIAAALPAFFINQYIGAFRYKISKSRMEKMRYIDTLKNIILKNDNIKEVKLFGVAEYLKSIILNQQVDFNKENRTNRRKFLSIDSSGSILNDIVNAFIKLWIISMAISLKITLGTANMYMNAVDTLKSSVDSIFTDISSSYEHTLYIESLFSILGKSNTPEMASQKDINGAIRKIEFDHVSFTYPGSSSPAIKDISFILHENTTYGFVGLNGAGKTTLLKLLLKLYTPDSGKIKVNGINICEIREKSLWKKMSAIFQDFIKYPVTVSQNITFGCLSKTSGMSMEEAAGYTGADAFIARLPRQYDTQLQKEWTDGSELSQGQWQKLALSRCIYRDAEVVIFDEPFSSLDALSEKSIIDKLRTTKTGRICLFVTHRYSSLSLADSLLVIKEGMLIEQGTHPQLMENHGYYSELFNAQTDSIKEMSHINNSQPDKPT